MITLFVNRHLPWRTHNASVHHPLPLLVKEGSLNFVSSPPAKGEWLPAARQTRGWRPENYKPSSKEAYHGDTERKDGCCAAGGHVTYW